MIAEDILKLPESLFKFLAKWTADKIKADALKGIFQNNVSNSQLREPYKSYKANWMQRRTVGKGNVTSKGETFFRNRKAKYTAKNPSGTGKRLKAYAGVSLASNESRFSNMYLTGQTLNSISQEVTKTNTFNSGFILWFNPRDDKDNDKIIFNRDKYGRDLVNIREENLNFIQSKIEGQLGHEIDKFTSESINITI